MRSWLETEEVGLGGGRIGDISRELRIGRDIKLKAPLRPKNSSRPSQSRKALLIQAEGSARGVAKSHSTHEATVGLAVWQVVVVLQHDPFRFSLQKRAWASNSQG